MAFENLRNGAIVLRVHLQQLANKTEDSNNILSTSEIHDDRATNYNWTAVIESLQRDQEGLQTRLDQFLSDCFSGTNQDAIDDERLKVLKTSLKRFVREEKALSFRLRKLLRRSGILRRSYEALNIEGFVHSDDERDEGEDSVRGLIMSKKLKIIKFYYLHAFVFTSGHKGFSTNIPGLMLKMKMLTNMMKNCGTNEVEERNIVGADEPDEDYDSDADEESVFKRGEEEFYLRQLGFNDSHFEAKNFYQFEEKIDQLAKEREFHAEKARKIESRTSFLERAARDDDESESLEEIRKMAIQVGILLSLSLTGFLFVASESKATVKQYLRYFKGVIKLLADANGGVVMRKVLSVLRSAEDVLFKLRKLNQEVLDDLEHRDDHDQSQDLEIDQVLDMLLREVLCLDSAMSFPTLPSDGDDDDDEEEHETLMNLQVGNLFDALKEGKKELGKIGKKVHYMKTLHCGLIEESADLTMARFRDVMDVKIIQTWQNLGKLGDESN